MAEEKSSPTISEQAQAAYKAMLDQFDFLKKQQWATTNYAALIYGALLWVRANVQITPHVQCLLTVITVGTAVLATSILLKLQHDTGNLRYRHKHVRMQLFGQAERDALQLEEYGGNVYMRGGLVLSALIGVCLVGAVLVILVLYWPAPLQPRS